MLCRRLTHRQQFNVRRSARKRTPYLNTVQLRIIVGWVERSETQQMLENVGFRSSTQPTQIYFYGLTEAYCPISTLIYAVAISHLPKPYPILTR